MRHRKQSIKLNRDTSLRKATLRAIATGLLKHERIRTTLAKAKLARRLAEKLITLGKRGDIGAQKRAMELLADKALVQKLFKDIAPLFKSRIGGYTRIIPDHRRLGDGAMMVYLEFTERKEIEIPKDKKVKKKGKATPNEKETAKEAKAPQKGEPKPHHSDKMDKDEKIIQEEQAKERVKSEQKHLDKGFFKGLKRYFRQK